MKKKIFIIELIIMFLLLSTMIPIIVLVANKAHYPMYFIYLTILCYLTLGLPIVLLLIELFNVAKIKDYNHLNYHSACMTFIILIGLALYLIMVNMNKASFYKLKIAYFIALPLALIIPIVVCIYLENKTHNEANKKIVRNR